MILTRMLRRIFSGNATSAPESVGVSAPRIGEAVIDVLPELTTPPRDQLFNFFMPMFWGTANPEAVATSAKAIVDLASNGHHFADNFLTWGRNMSMLDDLPFVKAWESNVESPSDKAIVWRRYVLACAAYHCVQLEGDFVEPLGRQRPHAQCRAAVVGTMPQRSDHEAEAHADEQQRARADHRKWDDEHRAQRLQHGRARGGHTEPDENPTRHCT